MLSNSIAHYCQKCLAANELGQEFCARCGTRLMLVVEPSAVRYDGVNSAVSPEEHLLERVSTLENTLVRITARLEQGLELLLRQAHNSYFDHTLIETLIAVLSETGTIQADKLDELWRERCKHDADEQDESNRRDRLRSNIIAACHGPARRTFEEYVNRGIDLLGQHKVERGIHELERAAAMVDDNAPLFSFIGKHFFQAGKMALARDYLARAFKVAPEDYGICLLLGLACGDEGEVEWAKELLSEVTRRNGASFAAHYGLGRLLAAEQKWAEALAHFKRALAARPSPEAHYAVGSIYYQLGRDRMAARHLRKATEMDEGYAAALYMLGMVLLRGGEPDQAREAFHAAVNINGDEPRYCAAARRVLRPDEATSTAPLFGLFRSARRRLVTSGDDRLAKALREDAISSTPLQNDL